MAPTRGYAILAGIADFYFLTLAIGVQVALYVAVTGRPIGPVTAFAIPLAALVASVTYHTRFAARTPWLSPGEWMHGRLVAEGVKRWTNPWGSNRWALFSANLLALVLLGNTWDILAEGMSLTIARTIVMTLYVALVALGLIALTPTSRCRPARPRSTDAARPAPGSRSCRPRRSPKLGTRPRSS